MANILLLIFTVICFVSQVIYSIFYSINIVNLSQLVNSSQTKIEANNDTIQQQKIDLYTQSSMAVTKSNANKLKYQTITKSIKL